MNSDQRHEVEDKILKLLSFNSEPQNLCVLKKDTLARLLNSIPIDCLRAFLATSLKDAPSVEGEEFPTWVKTTRLALGFETQEDFASAVGIPRDVLNKIERGHASIGRKRKHVVRAALISAMDRSERIVSDSNSG